MLTVSAESVGPLEVLLILQNFVVEAVRMRRNELAKLVDLQLLKFQVLVHERRCSISKC